ncbi:putative F-box family protein [Quillaja saponaria]|uniref:F-box family protein n=1 Tax=Quillaja saponaria TaxID=32244 RepID=A0AAD7LYH9_QUISA|nr:putative F-box family protein [Quillaja saponaria]
MDKPLHFHDTLPHDIITDIFSRLPVKSLIRFESLSKFWSNLFKTPEFISKHFQDWTHNNPSLILHHRQLDDIASDMPSLVYLLETEMTELVKVHIPTTNNFNSWLHIVGSSNGLLCLNQFLGLNYTAIRIGYGTRQQVRRLPAEVNSGFISSDYTILTGFGFSSQIDDYRVVRIYAGDDDSDHSGYSDSDQIPLDPVVLVEMYSLRSDSWKEINHSNLEFWDYEINSVTVNGRMFWIMSVSSMDHSDMILSFDLGEETFMKIVIHQGLYISSGWYYMELVSYKNLLGVMVYQDFEIEGRIFDLLVMKDNPHGGECWTKVFTVGPFLFIERPIAIWNDDIVFKIGLDDYGDKCCMCLFNPRTKEQKHFPTDEDHFSFQVYNYAESLVLLGANGETDTEEAH